jgi:hypothetical protein
MRWRMQKARRNEELMYSFEEKELWRIMICIRSEIRIIHKYSICLLILKVKLSGYRRSSASGDEAGYKIS